ncbi:MAG: helix-turn-helix transcriptional regulator [Clostridia bacterium]|nr:helix-turn-helix transcriptional regulator [Clostridia bacterium]
MLVSHKTIGRNIRSARQSAGLTQEQTAERLRISQLHFGRLERGERPASLEQLAQIAGVLGVTTASLLNGCVMDEQFTAAPSDSAVSLAQSVAALANGCSPKARALMLSLCQAVAQSDKESETK